MNEMFHFVALCAKKLEACKVSTPNKRNWMTLDVLRSDGRSMIIHELWLVKQFIRQEEQSWHNIYPCKCSRPFTYPSCWSAKKGKLGNSDQISIPFWKLHWEQKLVLHAQAASQIAVLCDAFPCGRVKQQREYQKKDLLCPAWGQLLDTSESWSYR